MLDILLNIVFYSVSVITIVVLWGEYFLPKQLRNWIELGIITLGKKFITYENWLYDHKDTIEIEAEIKQYKWKRIKHFLARILINFVAATFFIFEELFWELTLKRFLNWIDIFPWIQAQKESIPKLNKYLILSLFLSCFMMMEILGLSAPFVAYYSIVLGLLVYLSKFLLLIPVKFIFTVGEYKLMQIDWFNTRYHITMDSLYWFKTTQSYVRVYNVWGSIRITFKEWFASDTSFVKEVKVYFKTLKTWLESFAEISKKIEDEEMVKYNDTIINYSDINIELGKNNSEDVIFHIYIEDHKRTRKPRNIIDAKIKAIEYRKTYKNANIVIKV